MFVVTTSHDFPERNTTAPINASLYCKYNSKAQSALRDALISAGYVAGPQVHVVIKDAAPYHMQNALLPVRGL